MAERGLELTSAAQVLSQSREHQRMGPGRGVQGDWRSAPCWLGPLSSSTPAPGKRVTSVKVDVSRHCTPLCVGRPAHAAPAAGSGKKPTPVSHGSPLPCPHQPAGPAWTWADGQECTREPALRPGAGRGRVGGEGLPGRHWPNTMCFDNCHQNSSLGDSMRGPSQTKKPPN